MKILNGIDETVKYLSELREDQENSVLTKLNPKLIPPPLPKFFLGLLKV